MSMNKQRRFGWNRLSWTITSGLGFVIAGCGGESSPPAPAPSAKADAGPGVKSKKGTIGPGGRLAEGGDLSAREKRAARKGEQAP
jgi:hypothetical protein